ncbi:MAG TPA: hypothetical protein VFC78_19130 [Tepidisphaeraceae bacterium]|nr:hypothetical protein [Tepidisphaeraceae bacterium]
MKMNEDELFVTIRADSWQSSLGREAKVCGTAAIAAFLEQLERMVSAMEGKCLCVQS